MKIHVIIIAISFAIISIFGIANMKGNIANTLLAKDNQLIATPTHIMLAKTSFNNKAASLNDKVRKDVYNDGSSEEIAEVTKNIEYSFASSAIKPVYNNTLTKLAKLVIDDKYVVSLRGHADSVGSYKPNWMLSEKRAIKVKEYLISKGVDKTHIITIPFGSTIPIATNNTAEGRQKNRRVEIKLKEINQ